MGFDFQRYGGQKAYLQDLDGESGTEETSGTHCFNIYRSVNKCCNNIGCWSTVLVRNTFIPHSPHCLIRTINEIQIFYHISWCCSKARRLSCCLVQCDLVHCRCCTLNVTLTCAWRSPASSWQRWLIEAERWLKEDYLVAACY